MLGELSEQIEAEAHQPVLVGNEQLIAPGEKAPPPDSAVRPVRPRRNGVHRAAVPDLRLPALQLFRQIGLDQVSQTGFGPPRFFTVIEHNRHHRRQMATGRDLTRRCQILVEQSNIGQQPNRHEVINAGLELQQQIDVKPSLSPAQPPDHVIFALAQIMADRRLAHPFQGVEIQLRHPVLMDKAANQVGDHLAMREIYFNGRQNIFLQTAPTLSLPHCLSTFSADITEFFLFSSELSGFEQLA